MAAVNVGTALTYPLNVEFFELSIINATFPTADASVTTKLKLPLPSTAFSIDPIISPPPNVVAPKFVTFPSAIEPEALPVLNKAPPQQINFGSFNES